MRARFPFPGQSQDLVGTNRIEKYVCESRNSEINTVVAAGSEGRPSSLRVSDGSFENTNLRREFHVYGCCEEKWEFKGSWP
ncbi:hypothetical protein PM082_015448 [Marasmius tenuissimus]|nr:hypothetical protein PM082_015448 [Marasmius tenuissimus]